MGPGRVKVDVRFDKYTGMCAACPAVIAFCCCGYAQQAALLHPCVKVDVSVGVHFGFGLSRVRQGASASFNQL